MTSTRLAWVLAFAAIVTVSAASYRPSSAFAQDAPAADQVDASPKGLVGLGLVGAEIGFVVPALAGLHDVWAFIVFPVLGGTGGALAGHFLIDQNDETELSIAALATGIALVLPTMVITLSATAYDPEEDVGDPTNQPAAAPGAQRGSDARMARAEQLRRDATAGSGMLRLSERGLLLGVPGVSIRPDQTPEERLRFGGETHAELHVPVLSGAF